MCKRRVQRGRFDRVEGHAIGSRESILLSISFWKFSVLIFMFLHSLSSLLKSFQSVITWKKGLPKDCLAYLKENMILHPY